MRQLRINAAFLAFALAPLIYDLCASLVTGGSFGAALDEHNLWVFPFLVASGVTTLIYNYMQAADRQRLAPPDKRVENLITTVPVVNRVVKHRALVSGSGSLGDNDQADDYQEQRSPNASPETVESLVADLFVQLEAKTPRPEAYIAAWKLAALLGSSNVCAALRRLELDESQLSQSRLKWLIRPGESSTRSDDAFNAVQGRIGYLLREGGLKYVPPPPLTVDPYIAIALIAVRENKSPYHSACLVNPHDDDADIIRHLYHAEESVMIDEDSRREKGTSQSYLEQLAYRDIGKLIRLDLAHTNPSMASMQANLIAHVMRHFLDNELSSILFDSLSPSNQARLAASMFSASQWMSPVDWQYWAKTGHDLVHAPRLEVASNLSFASAGGLAVGIIVMACWQIVTWISYGWSWYFGSAHFMATWPGWLKLLAIIVAVVLCVVALIRLYVLGIAVATIGVIGLLLSVLASPVVRIHTWIGSWETASAIIICALIFSALLAWIGVFYSDRLYSEEPIQLGTVARGKLYKVLRRSRFRPQHDFGHEDWCTMAG